MSNAALFLKTHMSQLHIFQIFCVVSRAAIMFHHDVIEHLRELEHAWLLHFVPSPFKRNLIHEP